MISGGKIMSNFSISIPTVISKISVIVTSALMNAQLGKTISDFCKCDFHDANSNHCAHFVSHVMGYQFGYTCFDSTGKGDKKDEANLRVHEIFPQCPSVGLWADKPETVKMGLAFVTAKSNVNVKSKTMVNVPKKHIGIFVEDTIWHYSNPVDKVISQTSADFSHHYSGSSIALFYGEFPR
jgi:hypothetical protein